MDLPLPHHVPMFYEEDNLPNGAFLSGGRLTTFLDCALSEGGGRMMEQCEIMPVFYSLPTIFFPRFMFKETY